jgi:hypothetical protein
MSVNITFTGSLDAAGSALLAHLRAALDRNTAALTANTAQGVQTMSSIADLTAVAQAVADDDSALKSAIDGLVAAIEAASSLSPADQAALDAAVAQLQSAHADLATQAADASADPPVAP